MTVRPAGRPPRPEMLDLLKRLRSGEEVTVRVAAEQYRVPIGTLKARMKRWKDAGLVRIARFGGVEGSEAYYIGTPGPEAQRERRPPKPPKRPLTRGTATSLIQRFMTKYS